MRPNLTNEEYYHVYNRGVDKRSIFQDQHDISRFLDSMGEFNVPEIITSIAHARKRIRGRSPTPTSNRLVDVIAYCLNPNHYHFILKQNAEEGISKFMHKLGTGYTNYFNKKHNRSGSLFQGKYKCKLVQSEEALKYVSVYVNLNHKVHGYSGRSWTPTSSYEQYIGENSGENTCKINDKQSVLEHFKSPQDYKEYSEATLLEIKSNKELKNEI